MLQTSYFAKKTVLEVFKLTWIDLQKLIWMNFKATFLTLPVKMHTFFWILIFFSVLSCLSWLTNWVFSITAEKVTQNWSLSLLISQPLLFNKYFYCKTEIYPPDGLSDNSVPGNFGYFLTSFKGDCEVSCAKIFRIHCFNSTKKSFF